MYISRVKTKILPTGRQAKKIKPSLALFALVLIILASIHPAVYANDMTSGKILNLTNESRASEGLEALTLNTELSAAAKAKAQDMIEEDYFAHTSPGGLTPWYWLGQSGYQYHYAGENLAINYGSAKNQHTAWMKSPTHRANILNANYSEIGIAVVEGKIDGESALLTVVMFGSPKIMVPPVTEEESKLLPESVKGTSDIVVPTSVEIPVTTNIPAFPMPSFGSLWSPGNSYALAWLGIFEVILILSALYFFYRDAIEYVAFEKGLSIALSGDENFGSGDNKFDKKPEQLIIAKRE